MSEPQVLKRTEQESQETLKQENPKKKWYIIGGVLGTLAVIAAVLIIVFLVVLPRNGTAQNSGSNSPTPSSSPIVIDPNNEECRSNPRLARLEPELDSIMLGFHLDWEANGDLPDTISQKLGFTPAVFNAFLQLDPSRSPETSVRFEHFDWHVQQVAKVGGMLSMTIEPVALGQVTAAHMLEVAKRCLSANSAGVPLFLRWGHEQNADWTNYGYQQTLYTESFRNISRLIHSMTNLTGTFN
jgi:hypothetical protein